MSTFRRKGHWRTNKNGSTFWVGEHDVNSEAWEYNSLYSQDIFQKEGKRNNISFYSSFVNPNAKCPICKKSVFYYESPHGGKVYFDSLGPPWLKHQCLEYDLKQNNDQKCNFSDWTKENWEPFEIEQITKFKNSEIIVNGKVLKTGRNCSISLKASVDVIDQINNKLCHIKIDNFDKVTISTFKMTQGTNEINEITLEGHLNATSIDLTEKKTVKLKETWVKMQISSLDQDFKSLDHLIEHKGVHQKIYVYFSNIYLGFYENWMEELKEKYNLPAPERPSRDWFQKFKSRQKDLEKKWKV